MAAKQDGGATGRSRRPRSAPTAPEPALPAAEGTFRTWCVRACDGYYFPISYSTTKDQFETDQETCQAMCPAGEAGLYFHDAKEGGPENMTSTEGQAYSDLEAAFRYRTAIDRSCACTAGGATPLPALDAQGPGSAPGPVALTPRPRPAPGEDPETLLNRAGRFNPGVPQPAIASSGGALGSSVRVVWPDWQAEQSEVLISAVPSY